MKTSQKPIMWSKHLSRSILGSSPISLVTLGVFCKALHLLNHRVLSRNTYQPCSPKNPTQKPVADNNRRLFPSLPKPCPAGCPFSQATGPADHPLSAAAGSKTSTKERTLPLHSQLLKANETFEVFFGNMMFFWQADCLKACVCWAGENLYSRYKCRVD